MDTENYKKKYQAYQAKIIPEQEKIYKTHLEIDKQKLYKKIAEKVLFDEMVRIEKKKIKEIGIKEYCKEYNNTMGITSNDTDDELIEKFELMQIQELIGKKAINNKVIAYFITYSPHVDTPLSKILEILKKFKIKDGVKKIEYVIEQTGTEKNNNIGYHPHFHMLIKLDKESEASETARFYKYLKSKFPPGSDGVALQIQCIFTERTYNKKVDYLNGQKDEEKSDKVLGDVIWRKLNNLQDYYKIVEKKKIIIKK